MYNVGSIREFLVVVDFDVTRGMKLRQGGGRTPAAMEIRGKYQFKSSALS